MTPLVPRDQAARRFAVTVRRLDRYEAFGLIRVIRSEGVEGYTPEDVRKLGSIVSLQRDLGINLAGVDAVLRLKARIDVMHRYLFELANEFPDLLESSDDAGASRPAASP